MQLFDAPNMKNKYNKKKFGLKFKQTNKRLQDTFHKLTAALRCSNSRQHKKYKQKRLWRWHISRHSISQQQGYKSNLTPPHHSLIQIFTTAQNNPSAIRFYSSTLLHLTRCTKRMFFLIFQFVAELKHLFVTTADAFKQHNYVIMWMIVEITVMR